MCDKVRYVHTYTATRKQSVPLSTHQRWSADNSECNMCRPTVETLTKPKAWIACVTPEREKVNIPFATQQCQDTHTNLKMMKCVTKFGWTVLSHTLYSHNLPLSYIHLLRLLKDTLHGQCFPRQQHRNDSHEKNGPHSFISDKSTLTMVVTM